MRAYIKVLKPLQIFLLSMLMLLPMTSKAADTSKAAESLDLISVFSMILILFIILTILFILYALKVFVSYTSPAVEKKSLLTGIFTKLSDSVPVENEQEILTDHVYDGIRELDNNLPLWWKYMFYATIVFAGIYLYYYHFDGSGNLQIQEYEQELVAAEKQIKEYTAKASNSIDENSVTRLTDPVRIKNGQALFLQNCAACHGKEGEGGVGPNLTDEYWIHGGGVKNVFKTIKYGVPQNGMISWKAQISPGNMQEIASYILSISGTNPPNGKAPQGDKYEENKELAEN